MSRLRAALAWACALLALCAASAALAAGKFGADVPGAQDHPLIKRFTGSWLLGHRYSDWEQVSLPTGMAVADRKMKEVVTLESKVGLQTDGKIALYGIYFDTGKAELKPESKPQLEQMAKLLQAQPALKVYIVGHTDNQGALDANLALSQQRAQAVVSSLAGIYKIDAKRLVAKGVANLAPMASNAVEDGRARNRRVELVAQ